MINTKKRRVCMSFQPRPKSKVAVNDVTGKEIRTHYNETSYVNGWERIWGNEDAKTQQSDSRNSQTNNRGN